MKARQRRGHPVDDGVDRWTVEGRVRVGLDDLYNMGHRNGNLGAAIECCWKMKFEPRRSDRETKVRVTQQHLAAQGLPTITGRRIRASTSIIVVILIEI